MQKSYSIEKEDLFSYDIKKGISTFILSQKETDFTLFIKVIHLEDSLHVTQFKLDQNTKISSLSVELNDAAVLEMLLQSLIVLFDQAQQYQAKEIFLILSQQEAEYLSIIESFFDYISCVKTNEELKISFTIYNTRAIRSFLKEKAQSMSIKIKQILWQEQRCNSFVRHFLHTSEKGKYLFKTEDKGSVMFTKSDVNTPSMKRLNPPISNVILFPASKLPIRKGIHA